MASQLIAEAARRAAHALIATLGAASVQMQIAMPPVAGDDGEELGLRSPQFQADTVTPVAIDHSGEHTEMLVPADTLEATFSVEGSGAIATALETVTTIQIADDLYVVSGVEPVSIGGRDCMYRLLLRDLNEEVI